MGLIKWIKGKFSKPVSIKPTEDILMLSNQSGKIKLGKKLVVPEGYICLFVAKEKVCDRFVAGEHKLSVEGLPSLTRTLKLNIPNKKGKYKEYFSADIYFVKLSEIINQDFCSQQGIYIKKDKEFLGTTVLVKGSYNFEITDPILLMEALLKMYGKFNGKLAQRQIDIWTGDLVDRKIQKNKPSIQQVYERDSMCFEGLVDYLNKNTQDIGLKYSSIMINETILPKNVYKKVQLQFNEQFEQETNQSAQVGLNQTQLENKTQLANSAETLPVQNEEVWIEDETQKNATSSMIEKQVSNDENQSVFDFAGEIKSLETSVEIEKNNAQASEENVDANLQENMDEQKALEEEQYLANLGKSDETIEQMQSKINYKKCSHCGAFNSKDSNTCFNCKNSFKKICGHCGTEINNGDFVCPNCKSIVI